MAAKKHSAALSPTVSQVIDKYIDALRADDDIGTAAAEALDLLLRKGTVPKPEDIDTALFTAPPEDGA